MPRLRVPTGKGGASIGASMLSVARSQGGLAGRVSTVLCGAYAITRGESTISIGPACLASAVSDGGAASSDRHRGPLLKPPFVRGPSVAIHTGGTSWLMELLGWCPRGRVSASPSIAIVDPTFPAWLARHGMTVKYQESATSIRQPIGISTRTAMTMSDGAWVVDRACAMVRRALGNLTRIQVGPPTPISLPIALPVHLISFGRPCVAIINIVGIKSSATDGILLFSSVVVAALPNDRTVAVGTVGVFAELDATAESETSTAPLQLLLPLLHGIAVDVAAESDQANVSATPTASAASKPLLLNAVGASRAIAGHGEVDVGAKTERRATSETPTSPLPRRITSSTSLSVNLVGIDDVEGDGAGNASRVPPASCWPLHHPPPHAPAVLQSSPGLLLSITELWGAAISRMASTANPIRCREGSRGTPAREGGMQRTPTTDEHLAAAAMDRLGDGRPLAGGRTMTSEDQSLGEDAEQVVGGAPASEASPEARHLAGRNVTRPVGVAAASRPDGPG